MVGVIVFTNCHCERSEAISILRRVEIATVCFAVLAMTTPQIKFDRLLSQSVNTAENRGQKIENRGQRTENRGQKTEDKKQRTENRGQTI